MYSKLPYITFYPLIGAFHLINGQLVSNFYEKYVFYLRMWGKMRSGAWFLPSEWLSLQRLLVLCTSIIYDQKQTVYYALDGVNYRFNCQKSHFIPVLGTIVVIWLPSTRSGHNQWCFWNTQPIVLLPSRAISAAPTVKRNPFPLTSEILRTRPYRVFRCVRIW